jgi:putative DNA primase/helicase
MGYSLTPSTHFHKMMWLVGSGSNGKSVILNIMSALVGEHNTSAVPLKDFSKTFSLIGMKDKLINIDADFPIDGAIADDKMKIIVSGDLVKVEEKREKAFTCRITAKQWAAMNNLPKTKDNSHGFFRRVLMLTFNRKLEDHEQDKSLEKVLMTELPGIFNWALEGLHELLENDQFTVPTSSKTDLDEYKILSNPVAKFVQEHITLVDTKGSPKLGLLNKDVYTSFSLFCHANGFARMNSSTFGMRMKALGIVSSKSNGQAYYPVKLHDAEGYSSGYTTVPTGMSLVDVENAF